MWQYWRGIFAPHASFFFDRMWSLSGAGGNSYRSPPGPALFLRAALWSHVCTRKMASCDGSRCEIVALWQPLDGSPPIFIPSAFHFYYNFFCCSSCRRSPFFRTKSHSCFYTFLAARRKYFQPETRRIVKSNLKIFFFFKQQIYQLEISWMDNIIQNTLRASFEFEWVLSTIEPQRGRVASRRSVYEKNSLDFGCSYRWWASPIDFGF